MRSSECAQSFPGTRMSPASRTTTEGRRILLTQHAAVKPIADAPALSPRKQQPASRTPHRESTTSDTTRTRPHTATAEKSHSSACRLINRGVSQEVVRVLLDRETDRVSAPYARITGQTVRCRGEAAMKAGIKGERVTLAPEGLLGQAQWAKTRYGIVTQALSNGYCGLPVQRTCPHANACPTCPVFLTGPGFLPELHEQRTRTLTLLDNANSCGHTRVAEMNQQVAAGLDRMIGELEDGQNEHGETVEAG
jgi:hypothetical protein